jgi:hypothetical protein
MIPFRAVVTSSLAAAVIFSSCTTADAQNTAANLQQKLVSEYALTKATADRSDIVTAGAVLVLQKDNLLMYSTTNTIAPQNTYKNGKLSQGIFALSACKWCKTFNDKTGQSASNVDTRKFVTGEKFWVTKIDVHDDGVVFELFSDPISDVRYYADLKFPFPKNAQPPVDQVEASVAEVLKVQPADDAAASGGDAKKQPSAPAGQSTQAAAQPTDKPLAPIAAPPPPSDAPPPAPKTIALGQTKDQVAAIFGQPTKVVKLATKEIDYYPDMKVTFVHDKVTDVQ